MSHDICLGKKSLSYSEVILGVLQKHLMSHLINTVEILPHFHY